MEWQAELGEPVGVEIVVVPHDPATRDLATAIRAARLPGAARYAGPIDRALLDRALAPFRFDAAALGWLAELGRPEPTASPPRMRVA